MNENDSSKLVLNPFKGYTSLIKHKNDNGLVNVDDNLIITSDDVSSDDDYSEYLNPILISIDEYYNFATNIKRDNLGIPLIKKIIIGW